MFDYEYETEPPLGCLGQIIFGLAAALVLGFLIVFMVGCSGDGPRPRQRYRSPPGPGLQLPEDGELIQPEPKPQPPPSRYDQWLVGNQN